MCRGLLTFVVANSFPGYRLPLSLVLVSKSFARICSVALDPVEKVLRDFFFKIPFITIIMSSSKAIGIDLGTTYS
jgi:hypothetical protein